MKKKKTESLIKELRTSEESVSFNNVTELDDHKITEKVHGNLPSVITSSRKVNSEVRDFLDQTQLDAKFFARNEIQNK